VAKWSYLVWITSITASLHLHSQEPTIVTIAMSSTNKDPYQVFMNMTKKHAYAYYKSGSGDAGSLLYLKTCIVCAANVSSQQALRGLFPIPHCCTNCITNFSTGGRTSLALILWVRFGVRPSINGWCLCHNVCLPWVCLMFLN
jgi:hypothetical protein